MFSKKVCKINTNFLTAKLFFKNIQELFSLKNHQLHIQKLLGFYRHQTLKMNS